MELDKKSDSSIRAEGAEIFVQGYIMLELGYPTALASRNMPGYDILAQNIVNSRSCKIQVKYRSAVDSDGFRFSNLDFDIAILIIGNIGKISQKDSIKYKDNEIFVFTKNMIEQVITSGQTKDNLFPLPNRKKLKGKYDSNRNKWGLVIDLLED
ncbi:hypothetical protein [Spirochaeta dissipatitropha]